MHPQQPGWGYQAPPYGYQAPQMAYGVATPQSALLAATTLALNQSRPRFGQPAMASTPQPYMGPGAMLGVLPNQHRPASAQYPVPPRDHTRPYTPDGPSWSDTRFTSEGYTLSELAPQTWSTTEVGDELDDDRPIRKRARFEGPVVSEERQRCEPCRRDFRSSSELAGHQRQHVRCSEPGCSFEATSRVVDVHEEDRHLRFKPGKQPEQTKRDGPPGATIQGLGVALENPEQIAKWVEERKKRWPSAATVAEKERQRLERVAAGLEPARRERQRAPERGRGRGRDGARAQIQGGHLAPRRAAPTPLDVAQHEQASDGGSDAGTSTGEPPEAVTSGNTGDHVAGGGSDSDSSSGSEVDSGPDAVSSKVPVKGAAADGAGDTPTRIQRSCKYWGRGKCRAGDQCRYLHSKSDAAGPQIKQPKADSGARDAPRKADLMSKLLANDVAHEVSDLLQTIHFLADNDFLDDVELSPGEADEHFIEVLPNDAQPPLSA